MPAAQSPSAANHPQTESRPATRQPIDPEGATVLVVEDNVSNFVLIARLLGYMGIHCE